MPCPHCKITIIKRSNNESAVSAAAYQSGEKLFSEYDQEQKYYPYKNEVTHKEIMLPPHAPPEYADRNTLWNSAEAQEKQWNSQLARRFVLAIPREIPPGQYADLIRDYCREFFVSKGMIADFAIHDKGDGNPHAHILLTMRAMDEKGKWLPKCRKVYDLDKNGERIRLPSGRWKSHKENTVDWNDQKYAEIWRQGWADTANRYLEANNRPERLDLRSYARQVSEIAMGVIAMLFNRQIMNYFGSDALAVFGVIVQISGLVQCFTYVVGQAAQPIISENYSVHNWERIKGTRKYSLWTVAAFGVLWTAAVLLFPNVFVKIFMSPTDSVLQIAPGIMRIYGLAYLLLPLNIFATYYFQSVMQPKTALIISMARGMVLCGVLVFVLPALFGAKLLWWVMPVTELAVAIYTILCMVKSNRSLAFQ